MWTSATSAGLVAAIGVGTTAYVVASMPGAVPTTVWAAVSAGLGSAVAVAVVCAGRARSFGRRLGQNADGLWDRTARGREEIGLSLQRIRRGEQPASDAAWRPAAPGDFFAPIDAELHQLLATARRALVEASGLGLAPAIANGTSRQQVEVFVNLARRLQSLVHRAIQLLDDLENEVEDPDLLKGLFQVDHLATRIRRHAENLAVLGGGGSRRQWSNPVALTEVLRSAIAEVEQYPRVKLVPPIEGTLHGHAVADVVHLVAELVENATMFSAPHTQVLLRAQLVTAGVAIEVEDRGLGIDPATRHSINSLLSDPDRVDIGELLRDGRLGLYVVSALARRHHIVVQQQANIYGGNQAVVIIPSTLIGPSRSAGAQLDRVAATVIPRQYNGIAEQSPSTAHGIANALEVQTANHELIPAPVPPAIAVSAQPVYHTTGAVTVNFDVPAVDHATGIGGDRHHADEYGDRPELPRRVRQTHMAPRLQQTPVERDDRPVAGHDPALMASFMEGFNSAEADADGDATTRTADAEYTERG